MQKNLSGFINIRLRRDRKMHFEDDSMTFCFKTRKMSDGKFPVYFFNKIKNPISANNKWISLLSECYID